MTQEPLNLDPYETQVKMSTVRTGLDTIIQNDTF